MSSDRRGLVRYRLESPPVAVDCLREVLGQRADATVNVLSPINFTTVVGSSALKIGVPQGAFSFGFSYAFSSLHGKQCVS